MNRTPQHRAPRRIDSAPLARCTDTRFSHDQMCVEEACPRHDPEDYTIEARHVVRPILLTCPSKGCRVKGWSGSPGDRCVGCGGPSEKARR